jgi:hypothetical protein
MDKYHINPETGNPGLCSAKVKCPFGGDDVHYFSKEAAQKAFEESTKSEALKAWKKKVTHAPEPEEPVDFPADATPDTNAGHGRSTYFHGHVSTPKNKPAPSYGHGGFHGYTAPPAPAPAKPKKQPMTDYGHGRTSYGHGR